MKNTTTALVRTRLVAAALLSTLLSACAASGPAFTSVSLTPDSPKALVYVYRPNRVAGSAINYTVKANGTPVTKLENGGYFPLVIDPGSIEFEAKTEARTRVVVDVRAGETRYVQGSIGMGVFIGHPRLLEVDAATGAAEVKECKLLPAAGIRN